MPRPARASEARGDAGPHGLGLKARFALPVTGGLAVMMGIAAWTLDSTTTAVSQDLQRRAVAYGVALEADEATRDLEEAPEELTLDVPGDRDVKLRSVRLQSGRPATLYRVSELSRSGTETVELARFVVPTNEQDAGEKLRGVIVALTFGVILTGAGIALWSANAVARPIEVIVGDIARIARGDFEHKTLVRGSREIQQLARAINTMAKDLSAARETELELSIRRREVELAAGVREALIPLAAPIVPGYDVGSAHIASPRLSGDFHDFVELGGGRVGLLVCDVSGTGLPAAMIGAAARARLRAELERAADPAQALCAANRELARDVKRGMFVTAIYAVIDGGSARVSVACAGHKIPLLRYGAADKKLRLVQPEGIALGLDRGSVFERTLKVVELELDPGDRIVLANTGPVRLVDGNGHELGEKPFYAQVLRCAPHPTDACLKELRAALVKYAGEAELPVDVSIVTALRT